MKKIKKISSLFFFLMAASLMTACKMEPDRFSYPDGQEPDPSEQGAPGKNGFASDKKSNMDARGMAVLEATFSGLGKENSSGETGRNQMRATETGSGTTPICIDMGPYLSDEPGLGMETCSTITFNGTEIESMKMDMTLTYTDYVHEFGDNPLVPDDDSDILKLNGVIVSKGKAEPSNSADEPSKITIESLRSQPKVNAKNVTESGEEDCSASFACVDMTFTLSGEGTFGATGEKFIYVGDVNLVDTLTSATQYCNAKLTMTVDAAGFPTRRLECNGY
ncbi:MAG: hypothetical protein Q7T11_05005 [Deltaproteobacteria bacterium]|nr:hypothetical protein [Deltaproteobacteria bacterium]